LDTADVIMPPEARTEAVQKKIDAWRSTVRRYESDPGMQMGRKELSNRARTAESDRDFASATQKIFKRASVVTQISIIIVSASVIVSAAWLTWLGVGFGALGLALGFLAWITPEWVVGLHLP
jgi:hypothetical protein